MHMHTLAVFTLIDWSVVLAYFALVTIVGFVVARKSAAGDEYFLAHRSLPTWAVAVSLVATTLSASTFVGVPDAGFKGNLSYLILNIGGFIAVFLVAALFIPRLYKAGTVTIYGFIAQRFGEPARIAISCAFITGRLLASGARLFVASIPLCFLLFGASDPTKTQFAIAISLIGIVGTVYTAKGGVRAVVWVDTIQFAIVLGTAILTVAILLHKIPLSLPDILHFLQNSPDPDHKDKLVLLDTSLDPAKNYTLFTAFASTFLMAAVFGTDQDFAQRFLISKSPVKGGISVIASQFIGIAVVTLFLTIGLLLFTFYKSPAIAPPAYGLPGKSTAIYPWFLFHELPTGIAGIAVAGFFAIAQGSLDSAMNAVASSIVADLYLPYKRRKNPNEPLPETKASKLTVAGVGTLMCLFALFCALIYDPNQTTLLDFVLGMMNFALSGMLAIFLAALFTNRGNSGTVIAALITGALIVLALQDKITPYWTPAIFGHPQLIAWPWWMPIATPLAFLVCIAGRGYNKRDQQMEKSHDRRHNTRTDHHSH